MFYECQCLQHRVLRTSTEESVQSALRRLERRVTSTTENKHTVWPLRNANKDIVRSVFHCSWFRGLYWSIHGYGNTLCWPWSISRSALRTAMTRTPMISINNIEAWNKISSVSPEPTQHAAGDRNLFDRRTHSFLGHARGDPDRFALLLAHRTE